MFMIFILYFNKVIKLAASVKVIFVLMNYYTRFFIDL